MPLLASPAKTAGRQVNEKDQTPHIPPPGGLVRLSDRAAVVCRDRTGQPREPWDRGSTPEQERQGQLRLFAPLTVRSAGGVPAGKHAVRAGEPISEPPWRRGPAAKPAQGVARVHAVPLPVRDTATTRMLDRRLRTSREEHFR